MNSALAALGKPHLHIGAGIRNLAEGVYECRAGLDDRLAFVFIKTPPALYFFFLGDHAEIQQLIRSRR
jgi:hypothetical protein